MAPPPHGPHGQEPKPSPSRNIVSRSKGPNTSTARRPKKTAAPPRAVNRRNLPRSLTSFFSKLRPSRRAERGGTSRATDNDGEYQPVRQTTLGQTASTGKRHAAVNRHGLDSIPVDHWNTATTLPRRSHTTGSKRTTAHQPQLNLPLIGYRVPRKPITQHPSILPSSAHPQPHTNIIPPPPPPNLPPSSSPPPSARSRNLFLAKRELRRQRRSLKESGDFLGVTGVNPYTGELDIITPPTTSSSDNPEAPVLPTIKSSITTRTMAARRESLCSSPTTTSSLAALAQQVTDAREAYEAARQRAAVRKEGRWWQREEEKLARAEQRKEAVREVVLQQQVKWRAEEGGWSSVAEPKLSPIPQSLTTASSDAGTVHRTPVGGGSSPKRRGSFLGMAAVARVMERRRHRRRCVGEETPVVPEGQHGERGRLGREEEARRTLTVRFSTPQPIRRCQLGLSQWDGRTRPEHHRVWEPGDFTVLPQMNVGILLAESTAPYTPRGRVLELDSLSPAGQWADSLMQDLCGLERNSEVSDTDTVLLRTASEESDSGPDRTPPSACTLTITTTGCEQSPPSSLVDSPSSAVTHDGSPETRLTPPTPPTALSRPISPLSLTAAPKRVYSGSLASPVIMQPSASPSSDSPVLHGTGTPEIDSGKGEVVPLRNTTPTLSLDREPASAITSLPSTPEKTIVVVEDLCTPTKEHLMPISTPSPTQHERDREMRKTMRQKVTTDSPRPILTINKSTPQPPTYTSISLMTQPPFQQTPLTQPPEAVNQTIARGAARAAFTHHHHPDRTLPTKVPPPPPAPIPAMVRPDSPGSASQAKTKAKAAAAPGQGQGQGPDQDQGQGLSEKGKKTIATETEAAMGTMTTKNGGGFDRQVAARWAWTGAVLVGRVVGAYWRFVRPVFDGDSEVRRRVDGVDGGQATWGDWGLYFLAVAFVFLAVSAAVWAVRGVVWVVRLVGEVGRVLRIVAGLGFY